MNHDILRLLKASAKLQQTIDAEVRGWCKISTLQTLVILHVGQEGHMMQQALIALLNCNRGNLSRALGTMVSKGLVVRKRNFEGSHIFLTDTGSVMFEEITRRVESSTLGKDLGCITLAINTCL